MEYKASFTVFESLKKTIEEYKVKIDDMVKNEPDKELANKIQSIFYEGQYGDYTTEGKTSKDDADYEFDRRLNLIRLAQRDRKSFESIINNNINLFHGTNFNALPGMLKYGMLSLKESEDVGNEVNTGEEWSRWRGGKKVLREFISFTDQLNKAIFYSAMPPKDKVKLPSFGIVIGISKEDIEDLSHYYVPSAFPELGVKEAIPIDRIKNIFVPNGKEEIVRKMIGDRPIEVSTISDLLNDVQRMGQYEFKEEDVDELTKKLPNPTLKERISNWWKSITNRTNDKKMDYDR